eukprot:3158568-Amphidinium_carterae.3
MSALFRGAAVMQLSLELEARILAIVSFVSNHATVDEISQSHHIWTSHCQCGSASSTGSGPWEIVRPASVHTDKGSNMRVSKHTCIVIHAEPGTLNWHRIASSRRKTPKDVMSASSTKSNKAPRMNVRLQEAAQMSHSMVRRASTLRSALLSTLGSTRSA